MKLHATIAGTTYHVNLPGQDISIHMHFDGPQPNTYGVPKSSAQAYRSGGWVGDTREGGSCNFETYTITPHCNGTHTECIGHISLERLHLPQHLTHTLIPATLLSITPTTPAQTQDTYNPAIGPDDHVIDKATLQAAMPPAPREFRQAILIRTLPNPLDKQQRDYMQAHPAFFTIEAMAYLVELGIQHLLTDLPSVDRLFDEGRLSAHHIFWNLEPGSHTPGPDAHLHNTITEMIYVPDHIPDGTYLLDLQTAPFLADAAPSRPFLYTLEPQ